MKTIKNKIAKSIITYSIHPTLFGLCLVGSTETGICAVAFGDTEKRVLRDIAVRFPKATIIKAVKIPREHIVIICHLKTKKTLPRSQKNFSEIIFDIQGTDFQKKVWHTLMTIPFGKTSTYAKIANLIKSPQSVRAVGTAIGKNPIAYFIPCHRVVTSNGAVGNYHWGADRKKMMLEVEAAV